MAAINAPSENTITTTLDDSDSEALHLAERIAKKLRDSRPLPAIREPLPESNPRVATPHPG